MVEAGPLEASSDAAHATAMPVRRRRPRNSNRSETAASAARAETNPAIEIPTVPPGRQSISLEMLVGDALDLLKVTVEELKRTSAFLAAQQICFDSRTTWHMIWSRWSQSGVDITIKTDELNRFAALCRDGVRAMMNVQPANEMEVRELTTFIRNTRLRWVFSRTLVEEGVERTREVIGRSIELAGSSTVS